MSFTTVLAQVKSVLEGATGVVNVHDYPRYTKDLVELDARFVDGTTFSFWLIDRSAAPPLGEFRAYHRQHQFDLWHFRAVVDSAGSAKTFQALLDTVMDTFTDSDNRTLGGTADILVPPSLVEVVHGIHYPNEGGPLCHRGQIRLVASEQLTC